jgi:ferritin-like metal-binding protein YciE
MPSATRGDNYVEEDVRQMLGMMLKDAYSAEKQALRCMEKVQRQVSSDGLREVLETHIEETQGQIERVEQGMEMLNVQPGRHVCVAMRGLIEEAQHDIETVGEPGPMMDMAIVAGLRRIEHYEIAAYSTNVAVADALSEEEVADLLQETLEEEEQTDQKLTDVSESVLALALSTEQEDQDREEEEQEERSSSRQPRRTRSSSSRTSDRSSGRRSSGQRRSSGEGGTDDEGHRLNKDGSVDKRQFNRAPSEEGFPKNTADEELDEEKGRSRG